MLEGLNEKQLVAAKHFEGPMLVIAGAGSGKTRALTHRIAYLIKEKGVKPWNILAVTFTNKAAAEMKERVSNLLGAMADFQEPNIGTFHSICVRILRRHLHHLDFENAFAIYDTADQQILMKRIMEAMRIDPKRVNPKAILAHISNAKNQLVDATEYSRYANDYFSEKVAEIYPIYQRELQKNNALDFDDIIMKTVELFQKFPEILDYYQERFRFISVDEYQDTNKAQYVLIKLLAEKHRNLVAIGDADQSIYGWRGATIQNILDFEKDYPDAQVVLLEQNYRSTQVILDASNSVIEKNRQRKAKNLWTDKDGGEKIRRWLADNERHEGDMVAREISKILLEYESPNYQDFVVLYRTNAQSRTMEEVFLRHGIPYKIVGGIKFYERKEIKDILAYLKLINNPHDSVSLLRIINTPSRKIGGKTMEMVQDFARRNDLSLFNALLLASEIEGLSESKVEVLEKFVNLIKNLQTLNGGSSAAEMIKYALTESGYKKMLNDGSIENEARLENIGELITVAQKYDNLEAGVSLSIFLEEVSLIADIDTIDAGDNAVTLMTVHSAKGLEFTNVFIVGLEEGIFPHNRSLFDPQELEEERRLMYVAMTRARENLYLLHCRRRTLYGDSKANPPSQFLEDIDPELVEANFGGYKTRQHLNISEIGMRPIPVESAGKQAFGGDFYKQEKAVDLEENSSNLATGDRVSHATFGKGIVVAVIGGVATIAFEDSKVGIKKLALSVARLEKI